MARPVPDSHIPVSHDWGRVNDLMVRFNLADDQREAAEYIDHLQAELAHAARVIDAQALDVQALSKRRRHTLHRWSNRLRRLARGLPVPPLALINGGEIGRLYQQRAEDLPGYESAGPERR